MWPKWLAETLDRSSIDAKPHAAGTEPQHVLEESLLAVETRDHLSDHDGEDWDLLTDLDLLEGYGPERYGHEEKSDA